MTRPTRAANTATPPARARVPLTLGRWTWTGAGVLLALTAGPGCQRPAREPATPPPTRWTESARYEGQPALSPDGDQLAFVAHGETDLDLYVVDSAWKSAPRLLVGGPGSVAAPAWSPDGETLAYTDDRGGTPDIWSVVAAGGEPRQITADASRDTDPDWSPDGGRLVFVSDRSGGSQLWLLTLSTGVAELLTLPGAPAGATGALDPEWSGDRILFVGVLGAERNLFDIAATGGGWTRLTDGSAHKSRPARAGTGRIAFVSDTTSFQNLYVREADGRITTITDEATDHDHPTWLPGGTRLIYERRSPWGLMVWRPGGTTVDTVLAPRGGNFDPTWAPDGLELAYQSNLAGQDDIWRVGLDGGAAAVTSSREDDGEPDWSPMSRRIVYTAVHGGNSDIWIMDPSGIELTNLTQHAARDRTPRWTPDGRFILFSSDRMGSEDIWVMPAAGGEPRRLTDDPGAERAPTLAVTAAARWLVYESDRDGTRGLWRLPLHEELSPSGPPERLTHPENAGDWDARPAASPRDARVVFTRQRGGDRDLFLVDAAGNGEMPTPLAPDAGAQEDHGAWSADATRVAGEAGGNSDLWVRDVPVPAAAQRR